MPEKAWIDTSFSPRDRLRVCFLTEKGKVTDIIVIQYEAEIEGEWLPLVRYDRAHGYLHRDVIRPDGTQEKTKWPSEDLNQALTEAIQEIKRQWAFYRRAFGEGLRK